MKCVRCWSQSNKALYISQVKLAFCIIVMYKGHPFQIPYSNPLRFPFFLSFSSIFSDLWLFHMQNRLHMQIKHLKERFENFITIIAISFIFRIKEFTTCRIGIWHSMCIPNFQNSLCSCHFPCFNCAWVTLDMNSLIRRKSNIILTVLLPLISCWW